MNFKKYHVSRNLLDYTTVESSTNATATQISGGISVSGRYYVRFRTVEFTVGSTYTMSWKANTTSGTSAPSWRFHYSDNTYSSMPSSGGALIAEKEVSELLLYVSTSESCIVEFTEIMLNTGSQPLPYEPYSSEVWHSIPYYQHSTATDTLTLPAVIYPNASSVTVGIKGQSSQSGTPSPQSPVDVNGTGERTGNLFDYTKITEGKYINASGEETTSTGGGEDKLSHSDYIEIEPNTNYTFYKQKQYGASATNNAFCWFDENKNLINRDLWDAFYNVTDILHTSLSPNNAKYVIINFRGTYYNTGMLVQGSTAPSEYIPYGYKLPISNGSQTTPIYLGEVETERKVKKLVFDGTESWSFFEGTNIWQFYIGDVGLGGVAKSSALSNIVPYGATPDDRQYYEYGCYLVTGGSGVAFQMRGAKDTFTDVTAWKTYLQQQYAAGTPVTVWYVLATPQTAIVNEPLMRIGDYADSLTTSVSCTAGENTLDVQTTVQPSEVTATFEGWHPVSAAHERENGQWD